MRIPLLSRAARRKGGKRLLEAEPPEYDLWLVCTGGPLRGSAYPVTEQVPVTIGRGDGNVFRADSPGVREQHARLYWASGRLLLEGLEGDVYVNGGEDLPPHRPREVRPGDGFALSGGRDCFEIRN